eukprot:g228.t1
MTAFIPDDPLDQKLFWVLEKCRVLEDTVDETKAANSLLARENEALKEDMEELKQLTADLCNKMDQDKRVVSNATKKSEELQEKVTFLEEKLLKETSENMKTRKADARLHSLLVKKQTAADQLEERLHDLELKKELEINELQDAKEQLKQEMEVLKEQHQVHTEMQQVKVEEAIESKNKMAERLAESEEELSRIKQSYQNLMSRYETETTEYDKKLKETNEHLTNVLKEHEELSEKQAAHEKEIADVYLDVKDQLEAKVTLEKTLVDTTTALEETKTQLEKEVKKNLEYVRDRTEREKKWRIEHIQYEDMKNKMKEHRITMKKFQAIKEAKRSRTRRSKGR